MTEDRHWNDLYDRDVDEAAERAYRASQGLPDVVTRGRVLLEDARRVAENLARVLRPACERIEIAGSIRRGCDPVKDIELVAIPRGIPRDLFGEPIAGERTELDVVIAGLLEDGHLETREPRRMGRRYQALRAPRSGIAVDLFLVLPPAQWGAIFAIRTGGAEFSKWLVTRALARGRRVHQGQLLDEDGRAMETPTEADFIAGCGARIVPPEERS